MEAELTESVSEGNEDQETDESLSEDEEISIQARVRVADLPPTESASVSSSSE